MIFQSSDPDPIYPEVDIYHFLESNPCGVQPGKKIFVNPVTEEYLTFSQFQIETKQFAAGLQDKFGFKPRDVLAIFSYNQYDFGVPILGTLCAGGIVTTINHSYTVDEVVHQLKDSGAKYMVTIIDLLPVATKAAEICGIAPEAILLFGGKDGVGKRSYKSVYSKRLAAPIKIDMEDIAYLCYSSGTTGKSKGVMLTHRNITSNLTQIMSYDAEVIKEKNLVILVFLPLYHIYGLMNCLHISLITGAETVIMSKFDLPSFLQNIQKFEVTNTFIVPPVALALAKHPMVLDYNLSSLRHMACGAAPLPKELCNLIESRLGVYCRQGFGMTEASPLVACQRPGQRGPDGSVGPLVAGLKAKIIDPATGKELGVGEQGEWLIYGPNVMKGYLNNPEATKITIREDGWMHTGDIVYVDAQGNWFVVDRLKELIKYKGFQIPAAELEALLQTHPKVMDAAVIPAYDAAQATEIPRAYIVPHDASTADDALKKDIIDFITSKVAPHKKLRGGVVFINEIPKSASGKILRKDIVKLDREQNQTTQALARL
ncbi:hypothetical protein BX616_010227 [Lobosporangium transversale]|uniref:AMP binding protein n=1 Tax=Lobosporangium transversale TaxID=64571 RepID=A0A1Y2GVX5_9FUNG|nr:hypothetical protein BCR41DRAFT_333944 [Lobosporangium transversale]KAF9912770.1 hypothetical protein BX616_010227 [Lobosporangium transversale]ORZ23925.1 hypothetical protein BCR41DRAFT_333944 [Lobosporangium transversale]|eukprot:XP_021883739.1 hypothetical protein BCR41DRAFT_333944 [Lobosporangium transversale]